MYRRWGLHGIVVAALAAAVVAVAPSTARADPGDILLSLTPAYAAVDFDSRTPSGLGAAVEVGYGLSDSFWLRGIGILSAHPADADTTLMLPQGTITVVGGFVGARYAFDLLRTVPYVDVGLGVIHAQGAGTPGATNFAYQAAIGFERMQTRLWSWGFVVAYHGFVRNYSELPVYLFAGPRFTFHWD